MSLSRILRLLAFPAIGLLLLLAAYGWGRRELHLRFGGEQTPGRIVGMVLERPSGADVLAGLEVRVHLTLADGTRIEAATRDGAIVSGELVPADGAPPVALSPTDLLPPRAEPRAGAVVLSSDLRRVLDNALYGDAAILRWALLRESRRPTDPARVVRIEKHETVVGYFDVPGVPVLFEMNDGRVRLPAPAAAPGVVEVHAVFDRSSPAAVEAARGETLVEYRYLRNGQVIEPARRDFYLAAEPYSTRFRPIFAFNVEGRSIARLSHIGRHGGPTLALRLHGDCTVYFDPTNPAEAVLIADPGPPGNAWLAWFSRWCEGVFAQWGSTALIALAGLIFFGVGMIFLSLVFFPSRREPPPAANPSA